MKLKWIFRKQIKRRVRNPISQCIQMIKQLMIFNNVLKKFLKTRIRIIIRKIKGALMMIFQIVQILLLLLQMSQAKIKTISINGLIKRRIKIEQICPTKIKILFNKNLLVQYNPLNNNSNCLVVLTIKYKCKILLKNSNSNNKPKEMSIIL